MFVVSLFVLLAFGLNQLSINYAGASQYECGFKPLQSNKYALDVQFFQIGILFLLFDVEILLFFP
jgi:NADH:ubiquinone oxidoreductase subunit 3 (subunit A)